VLPVFTLSFVKKQHCCYFGLSLTGSFWFLSTVCHFLVNALARWYVHVSITSCCSVKRGWIIELVFDTEANLGLSYIVLYIIPVPPKIRILPSGTLEPLEQISQFFCFFATTCRTCLTITSLWHSAPTFVYNTLTVKHSIAPPHDPAVTVDLFVLYISHRLAA